MTCVSPPELDDRTLLIYIDGEASADVAAHIERCPHCRERAQRLARLQGRMTAQLYRLDCPAPSELGEYHLGMLPAAEMEAIRRHLEECPHCRREVAQLEGYLANLAPDLAPTLQPGPLEQAVERVRVWVARLVSGGTVGLPGQLAPAYAGPVYAGMRGDEWTAPLVYQADEVQVIVEIEADAGRPDRKSVLGLVTGLDEASAFKAHLWQAGQRVTTEPVDELGNFVLPGLLPGAYELILAGSDLEIHVQQIQVGDVEGERGEGEER